MRTKDIIQFSDTYFMLFKFRGPVVQLWYGKCWSDTSVDHNDKLQIWLASHWLFEVNGNMFFQYRYPSTWQPKGILQAFWVYTTIEWLMLLLLWQNITIFNIISIIMIVEIILKYYVHSYPIHIYSYYLCQSCQKIWSDIQQLKGFQTIKWSFVH